VTRKYYLRCEITCDNCGISDDLDDGESLFGKELEPHISKYYVKIDGEDYCFDCAEGLGLLRTERKK